MSSRKKWIIRVILIIGIPILLTAPHWGAWWRAGIFIRPMIFRRAYIETIARLTLPDSARIVEYKFGINPNGLEPFFAKIELDRYGYEALGGGIFPTPERCQLIVNRIISQWHHDIDSFNLDNLVEFRVMDSMISSLWWGIGSSTRIVYIVLTKEAPGIYFLYVLY